MKEVEPTQKELDALTNILEPSLDPNLHDIDYDEICKLAYTYLISLEKKYDKSIIVQQCMADCAISSKIKCSHLEKAYNLCMLSGEKKFALDMIEEILRDREDYGFSEDEINIWEMRKTQIKQRDTQGADRT